MRRISENAFGILANRWRVFRRSFHLNPKMFESVTLTVITLHNWLKRNSEIGKVYVPQSLIGSEDLDNGEVIEGSWKSDTPSKSWKSLYFTKANNPTKEAKFIRKELFKGVFFKRGLYYLAMAMCKTLYLNIENISSEQK